MKLILINNKFVTEDKAAISVLSNAFQRGYGVFETFRTFNNKKLFKEKDHIDRLFNSAKEIFLKIPYSKTEICGMLQKVLRKSIHRLQRIKIIAIEQNVIIISNHFKEDNILLSGVSLMSVKTVRAIPEVKSISYLPSFLSHQKATKKGFYDALLIGDDEEVYEGAYCNIFWFEGETLCTRKDKILEGVTRKAVLEISPYKAKFKTIKLKELMKKEEIFLTQSTRGIVPVVKINKKNVGNGEPGEKTKTLMEKLKLIQNQPYKRDMER